MDYKKYIADIPDFPIPGILFRDITPLMANGEVFKAATDDIIAFAIKVDAEVDLIFQFPARGIAFL